MRCVIRMVWAAVMAVVVVLAGCGGGGSTSPGDPTAAAQPVIRYAANLILTCAPNCLFDSLTIAPVEGAATLGTREIASVAISVDHAAAQVLKAPNSGNSAGQPIYVFPVAEHPEQTDFSSQRAGCSTSHYEITVTDVAGLSYTRYPRFCRDVPFNASSDYGNRIVTYSLAAAAPVDVSWTRTGGVADVAHSLGVTSRTWTLPALDGDFVTAVVPGTGTAVTLSAATDSGELAVSTFRAGASTYQTARLELSVCCGPAGSVPSAPTKTIAFVGGSLTPGTVTAHYRIVDPASGAVITELTAVPDPSGTSWPIVVKSGYELSLEVTPQSPDAHAFAQIVGAGPASANSNVPGVAARLKVFVP